MIQVNFVKFVNITKRRLRRCRTVWKTLVRGSLIKAENGNKLSEATDIATRL